MHLRNCLSYKEVNVVAVADTSKHALEYATNRGVKRTYENYEDLLRDASIDAVLISLPNHLHLESVTKGAEAGKDILLEKPLAGQLADGEKIVSSVEKNGVKLMLGYSLRFDPLLRGLREKIIDGYFGEVEIAEATNVSSGPFTPQADKIGPTPVPGWWFDKELVGGGALLDLGIHMIDLLVWYFGEVESVSSYLGYMFNMSVEDVATCIIKFKRGPLAIVNAGWFSKDYLNSISLNGTSRNFSAVVSKKSRLGFVWNDFKRIVGQGASTITAEELKYFIDCIRRDVEPSPSAEEGLSDLRIISMAYENASVLAQARM
jgi:predicted dehydrogenase